MTYTIGADDWRWDGARWTFADDGLRADFFIETRNGGSECAVVCASNTHCDEGNAFWYDCLASNDDTLGLSVLKLAPWGGEPFSVELGDALVQHLEWLVEIDETAEYVAFELCGAHDGEEVTDGTPWEFFAAYADELRGQAKRLHLNQGEFAALVWDAAVENELLERDGDGMVWTGRNGR